MKKYVKNKSFLTGLSIIGFLFAVMVVSLFYTPYGATEMDMTNLFGSPSAAHWLGTDNFGRDILSRMMIGSQTAFLVGFLSVVIGMLVGGAIGSVAGYFGGKVDTVLMKLIDTQMAYPGILIALMLISIFGTGVRNVVISLGVMSIPRFARITRAGFIQYKNYDFVKAARARGANAMRVMYVHILPNILSSLAVTCSLAFANSILLEAGLSYLGLGIQPPAPSWGMMLKEAQGFIYNSVTYAIGPGIMVTAMVLGFNLIGDGLRDVLDTRL